MHRAVLRWSETLDPSLEDQEVKKLSKVLSTRYTAYGSMLLLPPDTLDSSECRDILHPYDATSLYEHIAKDMKITHIAINHPIPPHSTGIPTLDPENKIRAPLNFQPVYGDFGASTCSSPPTPEDLSQAYWVTAKQNGISQTWAPRWTMFSRGNISEKARVLGLPSVKQAVMEGTRSGSGCSVVDLYAGIGYFTFSYVKAGVDKVLCWELNQWSCEGLRRGAKANRWTSATFDATSTSELAAGHEQILVFNETNELALQRINVMRALLPPIRHVNCGLLPTSRACYPTAFAALDPDLGGWIHAHENFGISEIEDRAIQAKDVFQDFLDGHKENKRIAVLESVTRVKTYAPGVFHCVLDIHIPPA